MGFAPCARQGLFLQAFGAAGAGIVMTLTCRNRSCSNVLRTWAVVRVPAEEPQGEAEPTLKGGCQTAGQRLRTKLSKV